MSARLDALHTFAGCGWNTVPLDRSAIQRATLAAYSSHAHGTVVESCQRLEVYHGGCDACEAPERWHGREAVRHLAEVAAGLHSVVLGEAQILGQVRRGLDGAAGAAQELGGLAIASARELRERTNFNSHAGALLDKALRLADLKSRGRILVLGPGQMGRLVALRALELGFEEVILAGRTAPEVRGFQVTPWILADLAGVGAVDCVAGCLGSGAEEMGTDALPPSPLVLDLGTPRNFRSDSQRLLLSLAELLADEATRPHAVRRRAGLRFELASIVDRRLEVWATTSGSAVGDLRRRMEVVRKREVERALRLHPGLDPAAADRLARALVNQLLDGPTRRMRDDPELALAGARLFGQVDSEDAAAPPPD